MPSRRRMAPMAPMPPTAAARSASARMRSLSFAVKLRRRGRADNSGDAAAGAGRCIDLSREHGHEAILDGRQPEGMTLPGLMEGVEVEWDAQGRAFCSPARPGA